MNKNTFKHTAQFLVQRAILAIRRCAVNLKLFLFTAYSDTIDTSEHKLSVGNVSLTKLRKIKNKLVSAFL